MCEIADNRVTETRPMMTPVHPVITAAHNRVGAVILANIFFAYEEI